MQDDISSPTNIASPKKPTLVTAESKTGDIDVGPGEGNLEDDKPKGESEFLCAEASKVICNGTTMALILAISIMFWITTGAMYWFSDYLITHLNMPEE